jgi:NADH dehydrogenase FAD-containing subunit
MQVEGHPHLFAAGDCIRVDSNQLAYLAGQHGELVAKNVSKFAANPQAQLKSWKPNGGTKMNIVGLGKRSVVLLFETGIFTLVPGSAAWFKGKKGKAMLGF